MPNDRRLKGRRILAVHPSPDRYGSDRMLVSSLEAFAANGADVVVCVPETGPLCDELASSHVKVVISAFPVLRKGLFSPIGIGRLTLTTPPSLASMVSLAREVQPDLIYVNTLTIPHWLVVSRLLRIPSVCHVHEAEEQLSKFTRTLLVAPLLLADRVIANSRATARFIDTVSSRTSARTVVVLNGVSIPSSYLGPPDGTPKVVALVGRLNPRKGQDVAIATVARLLRGGYDVELWLVGDAFSGYEEYERRLRELAAAHGVTERVRFLGYVDDVSAIYQQATIVVVPSRVEPFGNVAAEAMAEGRPVVASRVGGLAEVVDDGVTGILVDPEDDGALADAIAGLLDDPGLARHLGDAAAEHVSDHFSVARYEEDIVRVVRDCIA